MLPRSRTLARNPTLCPSGEEGLDRCTMRSEWKVSAFTVQIFREANKRKFDLIPVHDVQGWTKV